MQTEGKTARCQWVDAVKGFSIIAVVFGHIDYCLYNSVLLPMNLLLGLGWHVNLYFILGGFFLNEIKLSSPRTFIPHKLKTLYLPLICFSVPAALLHNYFLDIGWYDTVTDYGGKLMSEWSGTEMVRGVVSAFFLGGREPILSALWFLCALLMALCGLSVIFYLVRRFVHNPRHRTFTVITVLLAAALFSSLLTNAVGFHIPRFNRALTAMFWLYTGYFLFRVKGCRFDDKRVAIVSLILFYAGNVLIGITPFDSFALNTLTSFAALYIICYVFRSMEGSRLSRVIAYFGQDSLYIMILHFVGFRLATMCLNHCGYSLDLAASRAPAGTSLFLMAVYLFAGVVFPILFIRTWRRIKDKIKAII